MGLRLERLTITTEAIPDPALESIPAPDRKRIDAIWGDRHTGPQKHVGELKDLIARHPHIPMLWNHYAIALEASGQSAEAFRIIEETARKFPGYIFGLCNYVMVLLDTGRLDEARAIVEPESQRSLLSLIGVDPARSTFHITEAVAHASMAGHYLLATGRREAAVVQLEMIEQLAPDGPECRSLAIQMSDDDTVLDLAAELLLRAAGLRRVKRSSGAGVARNPARNKPPRASAKKQNREEAPAPKPPKPPKSDPGIFGD